MAVSGATAGCVAPLGQRVLLIGPSGNEAATGPVYPCFAHETMANLLDRAGLSWTYYTNSPTPGSIWNAPVAMIGICAPQRVGGTRVCTGADYTQHVTSAQAQILNDIAACKLSAVNWVVPDGLESDHASINNGTGPAWVASIVNAIGMQPACAGNETYWKDTAIFVTWDDWGGWYDHVPPFRVGGWPNENWGEGYIYGFRVPLLVVSAYTPAGYVDSDNHDFGSLLGFVETNFKLPRIGPGYWADAHGGSLAPFFTLSAPRPFTSIAASVTSAYFLHAKRSLRGPDDD
jgi:phospholipase C